MKDTVTEVGIFTPTTAIISAAPEGELIVSAISVRDRLVKNCISNDIRKIIILDPAGTTKKSRVEYANEKSATVEYVKDMAAANISPRDTTLYIKDGFLVHNSLLETFLSSGAKILKDPSDRENIFARVDFETQAKSTYSEDEIFAGDPFHVFPIQEKNLDEARTRLFKWLDKPSDGFISRTLNRPVSTLFSKFFADYPIHPAYFTALTALLAGLMTYVLLTGGENGILWGCILFHVVSVADGIDGEIARAKFQASLNGAKLDTTIDMITNILFMASLSYALWSTYGDAYLILGVYVVLLALMGVLLMTSLLYFGPGGGRFDILANTIRTHYMGRPVLLRIFNFCNYCLKRDAFAFIFAVFGLLGFGRYIPEFLIFGLTIWNLAIILNARTILKSKQPIEEI
ncbi:MAG: CDP-alcohol phosphatidyltransferase family protein [Emcibacter sp.]|nr:CDP-alcohol phosphatidyltransferase family protein [Emcibacter sp.]